MKELAAEAVEALEKAARWLSRAQHYAWCVQSSVGEDDCGCACGLWYVSKAVREALRGLANARLMAHAREDRALHRLLAQKRTDVALQCASIATTVGLTESAEYEMLLDTARSQGRAVGAGAAGRHISERIAERILREFGLEKP